jgi:4-amino-4-deoxy-L-arabinose transferase-like glycosyltransferase
LNIQARLKSADHPAAKGSVVSRFFPDSPRAMFLAALVIRFIACAFAYTALLDPSRDHWEFGWETGRVAHSLALGQGFASPWPGTVGATATVAPVYPLMLAGIFRLLGSFTAASALAILALNSLFSALTVFPVRRVAAKVFGESTARWAGWTWVLYPFATYFAATRVWETCLTTLLFSVVVLVTYRVAEEGNTSLWIGYGALWGLTACTSPVTLSALPLLLCWIGYRRRRTAMFFKRATLAVLVVIVFASPWFVRNFRVFHRVIPFRDNLWLEFHVGNNGDTSDVYIDAAHPAHNPAELQQYRDLGERGYFEAKKAEVLEFIRSHPGFFVWVTVRRILLTWTGFWSFSRQFLANEPFEIPNMALSLTTLVLLIRGIRRAWNSARIDSMPIFLCLLAIPAVYYVTHVDANYRHPVDPQIILLAVYGIVLKRTREARVAQPARM